MTATAEIAQIFYGTCPNSLKAPGPWRWRLSVSVGRGSCQCGHQGVASLQELVGSEFCVSIWVFPKNRGKNPKMDGENNGKPDFSMDDLGGKPHYFRKYPF